MGNRYACRECDKDAQIKKWNIDFCDGSEARSNMAKWTIPYLFLHLFPIPSPISSPNLLNTITLPHLESNDALSTCASILLAPAPPGPDI